MTLMVLVSTLFACSDSISYTDTTINTYNDMIPPVIVLSKNLSFGMYSVDLKDGTGKVYHFGNISTFANALGDSYAVGDTIK